MGTHGSGPAAGLSVPGPRQTDTLSVSLSLDKRGRHFTAADRLAPGTAMATSDTTAASVGMNGQVERMQATWRNEFHNVQDTAANITELNPMIDRYLETYNSWRPHDALIDSVVGVQ
ncbi:MAG: integrase core domain-containing protein [Rhodobacteraceae bacterium]|nr:integrase core domain-containing protein [Paracoccaceae bacterium]